MKVIPITGQTAKDFVAAHHRHHDPPQGYRFCIGLMHEGLLVGVMVVGRPVAGALQDGLTAEVTRCCVLTAAPKGACSKLYSAAQKAWFAMGGQRLITYTLASESGASLRGAGWKEVARVKGKKRGHPSRPRRVLPTDGMDKKRWEAVP